MADLAGIAGYYDAWTPDFLRFAGTTIQSGLAMPVGIDFEDADASARYLARRAGVRAGDLVLDAGCGVGGPAIAVARAFDVTIHGVTISPVQVSLGRRLVAQAGLADRVFLHLADFHALPFRAEIFDVVLVFEATCYSHDKPAMIRELVRALRLGGTLYLKDVFRRSGPVTDEQQVALDRFHEKWSCVASATMDEIRSAMEASALVGLMAREMHEVGTDHFFASMLELVEGGGMQLNRMGQELLLPAHDLPIIWGELRATKPI